MASLRTPGYAHSVLINAIRSFWAEAAEPNPPARDWKDWLLVSVLLALAIVEGLTTPDIVWAPLSVVLQLIPIVMLLFRRSHPLLSVAVAWAVITGLDIASIAAGLDSPGLYTMIGLIVFPYSLFRWGSGRDAFLGLAIMSVLHVVNMVYYPSGPELTLASFAFLLLPSTLGAAVRFRGRAQERAVAEAMLSEREQLARELHDTVAHHVSAIAIQAQAGYTLAATDPDASIRALETIKAEASVTLSEMRSIVALLRREGDEHGQRKTLADIDELADLDHRPPIEVAMTGALDDVAPPIQTAAFRIAQEATTNARRYARHARAITVAVEGTATHVTVTVADDGDASYFDAESASGYGLVGMRERATLHGGSFDVGPNQGRGWTVRAVLPKGGAQS
jgi:signal transduction histidine kinase